MVPSQQYNQEAIDAFTKQGKSIPGQSLTSNPDEPRPFEGPPEFTEFREALNFTAAELLQQDNYMSIVTAVGSGVPITDLVMQIGYVGFREGKWNPDLMMMLIEPLMYLIMALCEKAGVEYRIDDEDDEEDIDVSILEEKTKNIAEVAQSKIAQSGKIPSGALPSEIVEQIEETEVPESLLAKQEETTEEETPPPTESLLSRGQ